VRRRSVLSCVVGLSCCRVSSICLGLRRRSVLSCVVCMSCCHVSSIYLVVYGHTRQQDRATTQDRSMTQNNKTDRRHKTTRQIEDTRQQRQIDDTRQPCCRVASICLVLRRRSVLSCVVCMSCCHVSSIYLVVLCRRSVLLFCVVGLSCCHIYITTERQIDDTRQQDRSMTHDNKTDRRHTTTR
jgi:hypothetical protein